MKVDLYSASDADKIIEYASETSNISKASLQQAKRVIGSVWQIVNDYIIAKKQGEILIIFG